LRHQLPRRSQQSPNLAPVRDRPGRVEPVLEPVLIPLRSARLPAMYPAPAVGYSDGSWSRSFEVTVWKPEPRARGLSQCRMQLGDDRERQIEGLLSEVTQKTYACPELYSSCRVGPGNFTPSRSQIRT